MKTTIQKVAKGVKKLHEKEVSYKMSKATFNILLKLVKEELKYSKMFAKDAAKKLKIDYKQYEGDLIVAARCSLDKLYRLTMNHRDLYHTTNYKSNKKQIQEILAATFVEYIIGIDKGITIPEVNKQRALKRMLKYKDAFEKELRHYKLTEEDGKIKIVSMKEHCGSMDEETYTGGVVSSSEKESVVVLNLSDEGKNWIASIDHLKRSKDEVFVILITPENPDDGKPMPEFKDVFKVFEGTEENLKKWKDGKMDEIK